MKTNTLKPKKIAARLALFVLALFASAALRAQCNASFTHTPGPNGSVSFQGVSTTTSQAHVWFFGDGSSYPPPPILHLPLH